MINIWPFKKRNKHHANSNSAFVAKSKRRSVFAIIGASFISLLTFGGAGASIFMAAQQYALSAEYSDSYNIRIELDTWLTNEDPYAGADGHSKINPLDNNPNGGEGMPNGKIDQMTTNSANAYSQYLFQQGVSDFSVYPEFIPTDGTKPAQAYINAVIPNQKGFNRILKENEALPQENIMMNYTNSSRFSMMLDLIDSQSNQYISTISQEQLIGGSNKISIDNNSSKVDIDTTNFINSLSSGHGTWKDLRDSTTWFAGENNKSQIFFIRDLSGLVNRMSFILQVYKNNDSGGGDPEYNTPFSFISPSEFEWADKVFTNEKTAGNQDAQDLFYTPSSSVTNYDRMYDYNSFSGTDWAAPGDSHQINWGIVSKLIDQYGPNDTSDAKPANVPTWMKPYVIAIATSASDSSLSNSIKNFIPDKNPKNTSLENSGNWLTIPTSSKYDAQALIDQYNTYSFALPIKSFSGNTNNSENSTDPNKRVNYNPENPINPNTRISLRYDNTAQLHGIVPYLNDFATHKMPPSLTGNIFGATAILGSIIALASIILLIGIIVSILYRIPGVFGFGTILCSLSLTLFIMLSTGYALSLGLLSGLFIGLIVGVISVFAIMERIKKRYQTGVGFDSSFKTGTKKGLLPAIDLHAILLLCGVCFIYFNRLELEIFGVSIVFVSLLSFVFNVFLWNSINWIFFSNKINMLRHDLAFSLLKTKPAHLHENIVSNFDTSFHVKHNLKWFNVFGKKEIILSILLIAVAVTGLVILFTTGVRTSYVFYGGTRLVIPDEVINQGSWIPPSDWSDKFEYDGFWYYSYNYVIPFNSTAPAGVLFQNISSAAINSYVKMAINSALIASGLVCAYTFVRLNWISVIPAFVGLTTTPLLTIAILSICQVFFDINIVLALNILYMINAFFVINILSNISSTSIRTQSFNINDLMRILNHELKNQLYYFLFIIISVFGMTFILMLCSSTTLFWFYLPILIGTVISVIITFTIVPTLLSFFIKIRYKYWASNVLDNSGSQRWKSYDVVDEQLIDGINKTKKKIK